MINERHTIINVEEQQTAMHLLWELRALLTDCQQAGRRLTASDYGVVQRLRDFLDGKETR